MCAVDDTDDWTFFRDSIRTARKVHECRECRRMIERGESYHYATGLFDGQWFTFHVCRHCDAAGSWMRVVCGGWLLGELKDELRGHWWDGYSGLYIGRAIVGIGRQWRRRNGGGLMEPLPRFVCDHRDLAGTRCGLCGGSLIERPAA